MGKHTSYLFSKTISSEPRESKEIVKKLDAAANIWLPLDNYIFRERSVL